MRILMIEDNESNAYLARFLLERRGHEVVVATTGSDGVALAGASRYDLILLDLRLPDGDGCDFVPGLVPPAIPAATPVIAVSAHALAADRMRAIEVGCAAFIEKPIDVTTFAERLEHIAGASPAPATEP
ncbi:MAG: response regulator [Steroidobacteraceae bacterium]